MANKSVAENVAFFLEHYLYYSWVVCCHILIIADVWKWYRKILGGNLGINIGQKVRIDVHQKQRAQKNSGG